MSDLQEIKGLFSDTQKTVEALRSDVEDLKGKSADFIDADRQEKMKADLAAQFEAEQKAAMERIEALETAQNRPGAGGTTENSEYKSAFVNYLFTGQGEAELKAMSTQVNPDGGYMVTPQIEAGIRERQRRTSPVRAVANVISLAGNSYDILIDRNDAGAEWAGERAARNQTDTPTVNRISIALHELSALPRITQRLIDTTSFDIEGWLTNYVADKFARTESTAFVTGDGNNMPKGFLSYGKSTADDASRAVETLQYKATGANGDFAATAPADVLVHTFYELQAAYSANASWMMKNTTAATVSTLKDGDGSYLLQSMLNTDGAITRTIQGRPMYLADDMPAIGVDSYSIAVGDFNAGYTIVDGQSVTVLRDPFTAKPNVLFYTTKRVGGGLVEADAIKLIKFGTS